VDGEERWGFCGLEDTLKREQRTGGGGAAVWGEERWGGGGLEDTLKREQRTGGWGEPLFGWRRGGGFVGRRTR
jgi:hypothetical protein